MLGGEEKWIERCFGGETGRKETTSKSRYKWERNVNMALRKHDWRESGSG
jgi:hypothetical protein